MNEEMLKLDLQLCFRFYTASRGIIRLYKPLLDKIGITYPQYVTMLVMWEYEKIPFKELGKMVDMKTGTLTPVLQKLESLGYVKREKVEGDDRKSTVIITIEGLELKKEAAFIPEKIAEILCLTNEEYTEGVKVLDNFIERIYKARENK